MVKKMPKVSKLYPFEYSNCKQITSRTSHDTKTISFNTYIFTVSIYL